MIYTTPDILQSSETLRKEQVGLMIMDREFIYVDKEMNLEIKKQLQTLKADDYRGATFTKCMD
jgi:predicted ribonuclease YlaK